MPCNEMNLSCVMNPSEDRRKSGSRRHVEILERRILDLESAQHRMMQSHQQTSRPLRNDVGNDVEIRSEAPSGPVIGVSGTAGPHVFQLPVQLCTETFELDDPGITVSDHTVQLEYRLLQSFFNYQPLWVNAVDKKLFWEHRESRKPSMWYSHFLEAAMLASAARTSDSSAVRSLGERYSNQTKAGIIQALEDPSAASMQGFLILSDYEVCQGREHIGWQLCGKRKTFPLRKTTVLHWLICKHHVGMACRLLTDLGLHEPSGASEEAESTHMKKARLHLLSACITFEGIWCMYLGRPSMIRRSVLQAAAQCCEEYEWSDSSTVAAWLDLCGPMADICEVLNSTRLPNTDEKASLSRLDANLHSWLEKLPSSFVRNEPNAYEVLMQYCKARILVQRASGPGDEPPEVHRVRTYDAAIRIIHLLLLYRQTNGINQIRSVMLDTANFAIAALVDQFLERPDFLESKKSNYQWLRLAIESMMTVQPYFPIVGHKLQSMADTVEGTVLASLFTAVEP
jgi:hypothetical protein